MSEAPEYFSTRQVAPGIHAITEAGVVHCYLVQGRDWALLVDTGRGGRDLRAQIERLTDRPVIVVNTHGHADHIGGNAEFDTIAMHPADLERLEQGRLEWDLAVDLLPADPPNADQARSRWEAVTHEVDHGEVLDLGGRHIEVLHTPGHTPGSVCLLDEPSRFLFSGDTIHTGTVALHLEESDFDAYAQTAVLLESMGWDINLVLPAHGETPLDGGILLELGAGVRRLLDGEGLYQPTEWRGRPVFDAWLGDFSLRLRGPVGDPSRRAL